MNNDATIRTFDTTFNDERWELVEIACTTECYREYDDTPGLMEFIGYLGDPAMIPYLLDVEDIVKRHERRVLATLPGLTCRR